MRDSSDLAKLQPANTTPLLVDERKSIPSAGPSSSASGQYVPPVVPSTEHLKHTSTSSHSSQQQAAHQALTHIPKPFAGSSIRSLSKWALRAKHGAVEERVVDDEELDRDLREGIPEDEGDALRDPEDAGDLSAINKAIAHRKARKAAHGRTTTQNASGTDTENEWNSESEGGTDRAVVEAQLRSVAAAERMASSSAQSSASQASMDHSASSSSAPAVIASPLHVSSREHVDGAQALSPISPPVSVVFAERWRDKEARVAATSPFSHLPGWRLMPIIVKSNDDLRQEQFVCQLLQQFAAIYRRAKVPVWCRPYDILATEERGGMIQAIPDTISLDSLKRGDPNYADLNTWYERHFNYGPRGPERVRAARLNFVRSMAAYSIICYVLAIRDRHNGNILIDRRGHIMHIDFGFLLTASPGGNINFEAVPFKLTIEFVQVMGGPRSALFNTFRKLCIRAFLAVRKHRERIILLVEMMLSGNSDMKCFVGGAKAVMSGLRARFHEGASERQCAMIVHKLIDQSLDNWRTRWYDAFQRWSQGVM